MNTKGQTVTEYVLVIFILMGTFLALNEFFSSRFKSNFALLGEYMTSDLQTGSGFFDGWRNAEEK